MNSDLQEGLNLSSEIVRLVNEEPLTNIKIIVAPPFVHLAQVNKLINDQQNIYLGAQNCHQQDSGAFTGEISVSMLKSCGVEYVIIGHSERRMHFSESEVLLKEKVNAVLNYGLTPIFCCGEPLDIRESGKHEEYVKSQLTNSLFDLESGEFEKLIIAYEPIWAIGTGKTATSQQAQDMHGTIRDHIIDYYGSVATEIPILYGGSCNPSNAGELFACEDVDGGLIGGASLKSRDFIDIAKSFPK